MPVTISKPQPLETAEQFWNRLTPREKCLLTGWEDSSSPRLVLTPFYALRATDKIKIYDYMITNLPKVG